MTAIFLSTAIENSEHVLPRGIRRASKGPLELDEVHQVCTLFRQLGVASLFVEGQADPYHRCAMQSASLYLNQLRQQPEDAKVTSFIKPWFDAAASSYWDAAKLIAQASRATHNPKREYEDDFLYAWFLMQHAALDAPRAETEPILDRYSAVLEGAHDLRLDICRALLEDDPSGFETALADLLQDREERVNAMIDRGSISGDAASWVRSFALEGMALLSIAERQGMGPGPRFLHCPDIARGGSPYVFSPNAWMQVSITPNRRP